MCHLEHLVSAMLPTSSKTPHAQRPRSRWPLALSGLVLLSLAGCGGGAGNLSQADMIRAAQARKKAAEQNAAATPSPPTATAKPTTAKPATAKPEAGHVTGPAAPSADASQEPDPAATSPAATSPGSTSSLDATESPSGNAVPKSNGPPETEPGLAIPSREELFGPPPVYHSELERHKQAIANMKKIAEALEMYRRQVRTYPTPYVAVDKNSPPLLSWRVELLPYLGYDKLYKLFRLDEPWDSPNNQRLLALIPPEFQSPERLDTKTNYQVPVGDSTLFPGRKRISTRHVEDGLSHTVMLVEVDDPAAVPWTEPADWKFETASATRQLGGLRPGGFLVAWGEGLIGHVPADIPPSVAASMMTRDRGELFAYTKVHQEPHEAIELALQSPSKTEEETATADSATTNAATASTNPGLAPASNPSAIIGPGAKSRATPAAANPADRDIATAKLPPPSEAELQAAMKLLQEIYEAAYQEARTTQERQQLAKTILSTGSKLREDPHGRFATLELASKMASEAGDARLALEALEQLNQEFQIDLPAMQLDTLRRVAGGRSTSRAGSRQSTTIADTAYDLVLRLIDEDRYDEAEEAYRLGVTAARKSNDESLVEQFQKYRATLTEARNAYNRVRAYLAHATPDDPKASLAVGEYFSFVKHDWDRGLPYLAQGSDAELRELAQEELAVAASNSFTEPLHVADAWWDLAERTAAHKEAIHRHAYDWYVRLLGSMPEGLQKVKAEVRISEYRKRYR